ncbi:hypothetical protein HK097_006769, partial [Rhizophlyctis rosea]
MMMKLRMERERVMGVSEVERLKRELADYLPKEDTRGNEERRGGRLMLGFGEEREEPTNLNPKSEYQPPPYNSERGFCIC